MPAFAFDTHAAVKNLTGAGFDTAQAEAITDTVRDAVADSVATKASHPVKRERIENTTMKAELAELRNYMIKAGIGVVVAVAIANAALALAAYLYINS